MALFNGRGESTLEPTKLPQRIDEPPLFMFWRIDDLAPVMVLGAIGIIFEHMILAILIGAILVRFTKRYREAKPEGYLLHWFYWMGFIKGPRCSQSMVNSYARTWNN